MSLQGQDPPSPGTPGDGPSQDLTGEDGLESPLFAQSWRPSRLMQSFGS